MASQSGVALCFPPQSKMVGGGDSTALGQSRLIRE